MFCHCPLTCPISKQHVANSFLQHVIKTDTVVLSTWSRLQQEEREHFCVNLQLVLSKARAKADVYMIFGNN